MTGDRFAGVELGGTKCIAVLARGREIVDMLTVPTTSPDETLALLNAQLRIWNDAAPFVALGIASFGPVRLDPAMPDYGHILRTPKPGWSGAPVAARLTAGMICPWHIDTDVNAAALAEYLWGGGQGVSSLCYVTIGTGVGAGLVYDGNPVHGAMHPEMGHLRLRRYPGDQFSGSCSFHSDCIEGLVSGPALRDRFGEAPEHVSNTSPIWQEVAWDLAQLAGAILLATSVHRLLFGGSVARSRDFLLPAIREAMVANLAGYLTHFDIESADGVVALAALGEASGPLGAIALAVHRHKLRA